MLTDNEMTPQLTDSEKRGTTSAVCLLTPDRKRKTLMIRKCDNADFEMIYEIINDAARAYKGVIPADRWKEPYMPREELRHEIEQGVVFWCWEEDKDLLGVMGIQHVLDVTLIRHAYVRTAKQKQGVGGRLLSHLRELTSRPLLVGTWADAGWAVRFYQKRGFRLVSAEEKNFLLKKYWSIPERQIETSVVLADQKWSAHRRGNG
jgi:GNAT superfamily N-acetyltransferase